MNKIGVLDFAVKINILSGEFEFDCLRCIILLRPLYTAREVAHVTFAGAHFFFFFRSNVLHTAIAGKFPQFMFRSCRTF